MRGPRWFVMGGCFLVMCFGSSMARAGSGETKWTGTITFSGAVVEPTCSLSPADIDLAASIHEGHRPEPERFGCKITGQAQQTTSSSRLYSLRVVALDAPTINHDRVLEYFANYVKAQDSSGAPAKLVVQTFQ